MRRGGARRAAHEAWVAFMHRMRRRRMHRRISPRNDMLRGKRIGAKRRVDHFGTCVLVTELEEAVFFFFFS